MHLTGDLHFTSIFTELCKYILVFNWSPTCIDFSGSKAITLEFQNCTVDLLSTKQHVYHNLRSLCTNDLFRLRNYITRHLILHNVYILCLCNSFSTYGTCHFNRGKMFLKNQELLTTTVYKIVFNTYLYGENACKQCYCVMIIII